MVCRGKVVDTGEVGMVPFQKIVRQGGRHVSCLPGEILIFDSNQGLVATHVPSSCPGRAIGSVDILFPQFTRKRVWTSSTSQDHTDYAGDDIFKRQNTSQVTLVARLPFEVNGFRRGPPLLSYPERRFHPYLWLL